ncbi:muscle M-line assembly unc-89 isoform X2 [Olea europaea subsp. europaea]|uniref:Muscle M-line assembly unc-89 isoform X2 n=1 Tax=Olea europaea subsp. europaea TaxID=158383 RepID=A0A8S0SX26_OLEEU|nr:muscle M-line assembly unc-89 isoform X2 [Olea europaea subsp. europaea]
MAEGSISTMVTPEKDKFDKRNMGKISSGKSSSPNNRGNIYSQRRKASLGAYQARESMRRNSIEKLDSANNSQKSIPHYLRASTGSCHDFCKYGRIPEFEAKERRSIPKRTAEPSSNEQNSVGKTVPGEQKKKIVNHKASSSTKSHLPEHKPSPDAKSFSPKSKPSLDTQIYSTGKNASPGNKIHMQRHKPSSSRDTPSPYLPHIIKREIVLPSKNVEVPPKQDSSIDDKVPESEKKTENVFNKHSLSVKLKAVMVRVTSSSNISHGIHGKGRRNNDVKTGMNLASISSAKKALVPLPASVSPKISLHRTPSLKSRKIISLKVPSPLKDRNRIHKAQIKSFRNEKIPEKTLNVIRTDGPVFQSRPSSSSLASSSVAKSPSLLCHKVEEAEYDEGEIDELISDSNDTAEVGEVKLVKEKSIKALRKSTAVGSEDRDSTPMKLNFRRGKVVDLKSDNNNPRRLRFRRGRVLADDQDGKGDFRRKTFKNGMVNDDKNDEDPSSDKVALKHRDVQGKKYLRLFNNVIEETANKLVQSRKSKVKALVGAFETVISLQESKLRLQDAA